MSTSRLALVVIAKNEARCIERCLRSAGQFVDRMLVLDTGSTDDTVAIARRCGAEVHQAAWSGDFAAARNRALELANADWNLVLDADEWMEDGANCLATLQDFPTALGVVLVRSDIDIGTRREFSHTWLPRLLPHGVRYEGRIHEAPVSSLPRRRLPLVLGHDGYLPEQLKQKAGRNRQLLLQEIQNCPGDPYLLYQLGKDLEIAGEFSQACDQYFQALKAAPLNVAYRKDVLVRLLHCMSRSDALEQALEVAGEIMNECQEFPDYFFALGNLLLDCGVKNPEQAVGHWLPLAEAAWLRCLEIGERPELDGVPGRGSFLAAHNLAVLYAGMNQGEQARHYEQLARALKETARSPAAA